MKQYTLIQPPKVLQKARLDNIAIVPASQLPCKAVWQHVANTHRYGLKESTAGFDDLTS